MGWLAFFPVLGLLFLSGNTAPGGELLGWFALQTRRGIALFPWRCC